MPHLQTATCKVKSNMVENHNIVELDITSINANLALLHAYDSLVHPTFCLPTVNIETCTP